MLSEVAFLLLYIFVVYDLKKTTKKNIYLVVYLALALSLQDVKDL